MKTIIGNAFYVEGMPKLSAATHAQFDNGQEVKWVIDQRCTKPWKVNSNTENS